MTNLSVVAWRALGHWENWSKKIGLGQASLTAGCLTWALSAFFFFSTTVLYGNNSPRLPDFLRLCQDPWLWQVQDTALAYRRLVPSVAWVLDLPPLVAILVPHLSIILTLAFVYASFAKRTDHAAAMATTLALACTWLVFWTNAYLGYADAVTHLAVASALAISSPWASAGLAAVGFLNDERFVVAVPFLLMWHQNRWGRLALAYGFGMTLGLLVRHATQTGWIGPGFASADHLGIGWRWITTTWRPLESNWALFAYNVAASWRWLWAWPLLAVFGASRWPLVSRFAFLAGLAVTAASAALVHDVARSITFAFPAILVAAGRVAEIDRHRFRAYLVPIAILNLVTPALIFNGILPSAMIPLPIELALFAIWKITGVQILYELYLLLPGILISEF
jgi:hypothetical protein